jgi:hypothetical protein
VIPARRGILAADRDLDHLGSHALAAVRAALRLVIRVGAVSAGKRPLIPSRRRREAVNPDAILDRAIQIRCPVRNTRCIKSDYHPRRIDLKWFEPKTICPLIAVRDREER